MTSAPSQPPVRLLLAEDEPLVRAALHRLCREQGFDVAGEAATGHAIVAMTERLRPDAVLMDIEMPGLDGLAATRTIQNRCPTPVVIVTAHGTEELLQRASQEGAGAYLIKPPDPHALKRSVAIAMARHADLARVRTLARQQELLRREIHHRVANQFSAVSTILHLQAQDSREPATRQALQDAEQRIAVLARIHVRLQHHEAVPDEGVHVGPFVCALARDLVKGLRPDLHFKADWDSTLPPVPTASATLCGLLAHELVMNALRHAFVLRKEGGISLSLQRGPPGQLVLAVRDNGSGTTSPTPAKQFHTLGLMIVTSLTRDLGGTFTLAPLNPGTECLVTFPLATKDLA